MQSVRKGFDLGHVWNIMQLLLFAIISVTLAMGAGSSRLDNSVVGTPTISCERDRIRVKITTTHPFAGKVFVKGEYSNKDCVRSYMNGVPTAQKGHQRVQERGSQLKSEGEISASSVENAENIETHLDSSLWTSNEDDGLQDLSPLPAPKEAYRFNSGDKTLAGNKYAGNDIGTTRNNEELTSYKRIGGDGSSGNRPKVHYVGVFGGSDNESMTSSLQSILTADVADLKIHQKPKLVQEDLLSLHYPGPQGFVAGNCPIKCDPCVCPSEKVPLERKRRNTHIAELSVLLGACNAKRDRKLSPPSLVVSFVAVISFHESFITKLDRAYHIQCAYTESNKSISTQLDVGMAAPTDLNTTAVLPVCEYRISNAEGKAIQNIRVGDRVKHEWRCTAAAPTLYSMIVHSCFVEDGAGQRYEVIDEFGCSLDRYILSTPTYSADGLTAEVDAYMMKFPDKSTVDFQCAVKVCSKLDLNCTAVTPPDCSLNRVSQRKRRETKMTGESMTIHANSLTVLDADFTQEIPNDPAYAELGTLPSEFCFSVVGFAILVSTSTFFTTAALGVAGANLYLRSQSI